MGGEYDPPTTSSNSNQLLIGLVAGATSLAVAAVVLVVIFSPGEDAIGDDRAAGSQEVKPADTSGWTPAQKDAWSKWVAAVPADDRDDVHVLALRGSNFRSWVIRSRTNYQAHRRLDVPDGPNHLTGWHSGPEFRFGLAPDKADESAARAASEPWARAVVTVRLHRSPPEVVRWHAGRTDEAERSLRACFARLAERVAY